jgi:hypothetical protein
MGIEAVDADAIEGVANGGVEVVGEVDERGEAAVVGGRVDYAVVGEQGVPG